MMIDLERQIELNGTPSKRESDRERIAKDMAEWESKHGPIETTPIRTGPPHKLTFKEIQMMGINKRTRG